MKRTLKIITTCLFIAVSQNVAGLKAQGEQDQVVKVDSNLVSLFFSAVDKENRFVSSLDRSGVTVYEDGVRQEILTFQHDTDRPLSLALLIDVSGSEKLKLAQEKAAAKSFLNAVIRSRRDQVAVVSFAADPFVEQALTNNLEDARRAIDRVEPLKGIAGYQGQGQIMPIGTKPAAGFLSYTSAIWDALWITSRYLFSPSPVHSRRVIVIVTDGEDTSSRANLNEAIDLTLKADTVVYTIGVGDTSIAQGVNKDALSKLAVRTGGQFFSPRTDEDLTGAFERISNELRSQYLVTYVPQNQNAEQSYRQVRIELGGPRRHQPRLFYRPGYYFKRHDARP